jgi:hypothetical protein
VDGDSGQIKNLLKPPPASGEGPIPNDDGMRNLRMYRRDIYGDGLHFDQIGHKDVSFSGALSVIKSAYSTWEYFGMTAIKTSVCLGGSINTQAGYNLSIQSKTTSSVADSELILTNTTSISINYTGDGDTRPINRRFIIWKRTG